MENIYIEQSFHTPEVSFDNEKNRLYIVGKSYPEDASKFYEPIVAWLEENISEIMFHGQLVVICQAGKQPGVMTLTVRDRDTGMKSTTRIVVE